MQSGEEQAARQAAMQLRSQEMQQVQAEEGRQQMDAATEQKKAMVRAVLEPAALERLNRIGLLKPEKQRTFEDIIIANVKRGAIKQKIDESTLIAMIEQIGSSAVTGATVSTTSVSFKRRAFDDDDDVEINL
jgi:programmed cell death protein 5